MLYIVEHDHKYGVSSYLVSSQFRPTKKIVIEKCQIDYEPEKGETILINPAEIFDIDK